MKNTKKYKNYKLNKTIEKRYNILILIIIFLMIIIITALFKIQILNHEYYELKVLENSKTLVYSTSTPRGRIYDRNGKIIVDNKPVLVIYYKKPNGITTSEEIVSSYKLASIIDIDYTNLSDRNLKKFLINKSEDKLDSKITSDEWKLLDERKITLTDIEDYKIERIDLDEYDLNEVDYKSAYIYYLMNTGYSYSYKEIKKGDVSDIEYATVAEMRELLPGFDVKLDWERYYPYGDVFRTILGNVSTTSTGLPYELKDYYLNLGYNLNDRVGTTYLEYQYESLLKGEKTVYELNKDGSYKVVKKGSRGNDIMITIDIELQKEVEKILETEIRNAKKEENTKYYNSSMVIISDPNTGEILSMAGKILEDDTIYDYTPSIITMPVTAGSIVKGASHTVGYKEGALLIGERRIDECIKIKGTPLKCSWTTLGNIDDIQALKYSSNVYQYLTAIKVGKSSYQYNKSLSLDETAFDTYRNIFASYGLGVYTGIDLPNESLGYKGSSNTGYLLDFAIGQYDTYTPIELMQYINTIANKGTRLKPYLLKAVYNSNNLIYENTKVELNKVDIDSVYMDRIRKGFRAVMEVGGTGYYFIDPKYNAAGKTGTSESFIDSDNDGIIDKETMSNTFGAYAPYDNPKVSFLVVSPNIYYKESSSTARSGVNRKISRLISQKYFDLYK